MSDHILFYRRPLNNPRWWWCICFYRAVGFGVMIGVRLRDGGWWWSRGDILVICGLLIDGLGVDDIRAANRWVSYQDRKPVSSALREVYTAANEDAARAALDAFEASELGRKLPAISQRLARCYP